MDAAKKAAREKALQRISEGLSKTNENETLPSPKKTGTKVRAQSENDSSGKAPSVDPVPPSKGGGETKNGMTQEQRDNAREQVLKFLKGGKGTGGGEVRPQSFYDLNKKTIDKNNGTMHAEDFEEGKEAEDMGMDYEKFKSMSKAELQKAADFFKRLADLNSKDQE